MKTGCPHWFKFYVDDWLGGTVGMTALERICFLDLIVAQFRRGYVTRKQAVLFAEGDEVVANTVLEEKFEQVEGEEIFQNAKMRAVRAEAFSEYAAKCEKTEKMRAAKAAKRARENAGPLCKDSLQRPFANSLCETSRTQNPEPRVQSTEPRTQNNKPPTGVVGGEGKKRRTRAGVIDEQVGRVPVAFRELWRQWLTGKTNLKLDSLEAATKRVLDRIERTSVEFIADRVELALTSGWKGWEPRDGIDALVAQYRATKGGGGVKPSTEIRLEGGQGFRGNSPVPIQRGDLPVELQQQIAATELFYRTCQERLERRRSLIQSGVDTLEELVELLWRFELVIDLGAAAKQPLDAGFDPDVWQVPTEPKPRTILRERIAAGIAIFKPDRLWVGEFTRQEIQDRHPEGSVRLEKPYRPLALDLVPARIRPQEATK